MMPRGCRPVACDPGATWICIGLRRGDPIWDEKMAHHSMGAQGMMHTSCFGS